MRLPSTARAAWLLAALFLVSASTGGCTSGPSSQCLNPQPLPPWCGAAPAPGLPTGGEDAGGATAPRAGQDGGGLGGSGATTGTGGAADAGVSSAPADAGERSSDRDPVESDASTERLDDLDASRSDSGAQDAADEPMTEAGE